MDKRKEAALRREAARLIREGKMPSLETLCEAILGTRKKYAPRIRRAKREYRAKISIN
jgi:hypothetical protein